MTRKKENDNDKEVQSGEHIEPTNENTAQEVVVDAPLHPSKDLLEPESLEDVIKGSPKPTTDDGGTAVITEGDEMLDTSVHTDANAEESQDTTMGGLVVEHDPIFQSKTSNPYTVVKMSGSPQPPPLEVTDEWQPESAPRNRGASLIDPERLKGNTDHHFYAKEYWDGAGVPTCSKCGEKLRTDTYGHPICPIAAGDCPVIDAANERAKLQRDRIDERNKAREELEEKANEVGRKVGRKGGDHRAK